MEINPSTFSPRHRHISATSITSHHPSSHTPRSASTSSASSATSTPSSHSDPPPDPDISHTPRGRSGADTDETHSAAAMALLGLSKRTPSDSGTPAPSSAAASSPGPILAGIAMSVTLSSASDSGSSSTDSTGSTRPSMKKRRSSDSSGETGETGGTTEDAGRGKRTRGSQGSGGSPPTPKTKSDGWTEEMKKVYEQAAFALPPSGREQRRLFCDMRGRNEQLGLWVTLEIGTYCGRKRISSHSQTLKNHHGTNPELKKVLTTESGSSTYMNPPVMSDWPLHLKQLVHRAFSSLPNPPQLPPAANLDLANCPIPAIMVRVVRKDGVEVEMTLPDAIEYDKADQRSKNKDKKPSRARSRGKKSRTATPSHSRGTSSTTSHRQSSIASSAYSPIRPIVPLIHHRTMSNTVPRDIDRQTRYRQYSNTDLPPPLPLMPPPYYRTESSGSGSYSRPIQPASAPGQYGISPYSNRIPPPPTPTRQFQSSSMPSTSTSMPTFRELSSPRPESDEKKRSSIDEDEDDSPPHITRQPHPPSLDFLLGESESPKLAQTKRTFWK